MLKKRQLACMFVCLSLASFGLSACAGEEDEATNIKIWTAPSYIKVLQDIDYGTSEAYKDTYETYYNNDTFEVSLYKNELEGGQIILTPDKAISSYTVQLAALTSTEGNTLPVNAMKVYNQKYVDVYLASQYRSESMLGMMPDALLPMEAAVEYGENKIAANENQGIYIEIDTAGVEAGVYTGKFTVKADSVTYDINAKVTVWDATVPDKVNMQTTFLLRTKELLELELDSSEEMYRKYYEKLLDYRICLNDLPGDGLWENYVEQLRKYYADERVSYIPFPSFENTTWTNYDIPKAQEYFKKIAELCFEDGKNYYSKLAKYLSIIDEPHITKTEHLVVPVYKGLAKARRTVIKELQASRAVYDVSDELFETVLDEIENFEFICTTAQRDDFEYENNKSNPEDPEEAYVITWCPTFTSYNSNTGIEAHRQDGVLEWWYGCITPVNPYPSYHLDDKILSARVQSWMASKYEVTGNLYWGVNKQFQYNAFRETESIEDPYDPTNLAWPSNGDGYLVYPGKPYGLDCFVPSLRLTTIRDGMEDYEILKQTSEKTSALATSAGYADYDINETYSAMYDSLFQGTRMMGDSEDFTAARDLLAQFSVFADKGAFIAQVENKTLSTIVTVYVQEGGTLKRNGVEPAYTEKAGGKEYKIEVQQNQDINMLNLTLEKNGDTVKFEMNVGGKKAGIATDKITYSALNNMNSVTTEMIDGGVKIILGENAAVATQIVSLNGTEIQSRLKSGVKSIQLEIENTGDPFKLEFKYVGRQPVVYPFTDTFEIGTGTTNVTLNIATLDWSLIGAIKDFRMYLTYADMQERSIIVKSVTVAY